MHVFQLSQTDLDRYDFFEPKDLGKWCYIVCGTYQGFFETEEDAIASSKYIQN